MPVQVSLMPPVLGGSGASFPTIPESGKTMVEQLPEVQKKSAPSISVHNIQEVGTASDLGVSSFCFFGRSVHKMVQIYHGLYHRKKHAKKKHARNPSDSCAKEACQKNEKRIIALWRSEKLQVGNLSAP